MYNIYIIIIITEYYVYTVYMYVVDIIMFTGYMQDM